jgi:hypothetical protein
VVLTEYAERDRLILEYQLVRPRRGKLVLLAPPPGDRVHKYIEAVVAFTTPEWVGVDVKGETWRFRAGTSLLLRRDAVLELDGKLVAPDVAVTGVYPPETQSQAYAARAIEQALGRTLSSNSDKPDPQTGV